MNALQVISELEVEITETAVTLAGLRARKREVVELLGQQTFDVQERALLQIIGQAQAEIAEIEENNASELRAARMAAAPGAALQIPARLRI